MCRSRSDCYTRGLLCFLTPPYSVTIGAVKLSLEDFPFLSFLKLLLNSRLVYAFTHNGLTGGVPRCALAARYFADLLLPLFVMSGFTMPWSATRSDR